MSSGCYYLNLALNENFCSENDDVLCVSESLDDNNLKTLMGTGCLGTRFPEEYDAWEKRKTKIEKDFQQNFGRRHTEIHDTLMQNSGDIQAKVREAVISEILKAFP